MLYKKRATPGFNRLKTTTTTTTTNIRCTLAPGDGQRAFHATERCSTFVDAVRQWSITMQAPTL